MVEIHALFCICATYQHEEEAGGVAVETTVCNMSQSKSESISEHLYSCQSSAQQTD